MNENSEGHQTFRHWGHNVCPKVILEGARITRKTELALALNEHPNFVGPRKYRYLTRRSSRRSGAALPTHLGVKGWLILGKTTKHWRFEPTSFGHCSSSISRSAHGSSTASICPPRFIGGSITSQNLLKLFIRCRVACFCASPLPWNGSRAV
jgi:hypothetical protein